MVTDNQFSRDSVDDLLYRFSRIQNNITPYLAELALGAELAAWAATAFDTFKAARLEMSYRSNDMKAKTYLLEQALDELSEIYQIARKYAAGKYDEHKERIISMGFDDEYPTVQRQQIHWVDNVVKEHARWVADGITPLFKPALVTRLQTAVTAAEAALKARDDAQGDLKHSRKVYKILKESHIDNLTALYGEAIATWDPDSVNLIDLGFAMESDLGQGGGGQVPPVPVANYDEETETLLWGGDEFDTSSDVQTTDDNGATTEDVLIAEDVHQVVIARTSVEKKARVRSRNQHGASEWSAWVTIAALVGLAFPGGFAYNAALGKFIWLLVANATGYEMEVSYDAGATWNQIFDSAFAVGEYVWTPPSGTHHFRIRSKNATQVSAWFEIVLTIP